MHSCGNPHHNHDDDDDDAHNPEADGLTQRIMNIEYYEQWRYRDL